MQTKEDIHYDDIVAMTQPTNEEAELDLDSIEEFNDPFAKFEDWAMNLGEDNAITSQDEEEKAAAVEKLQSLVGEHFPAGVDGQNAINSLKGIIDDPELAREIKDAAKEDADTCVRPLVYQWLENNAPDVIDELDFGDMDMPADQGDEGGETDDSYALASAGHGSDEDYGDFGSEYEGIEQQQDHVNVQEVAEFMFTGYDPVKKTFPKGPEGMITMVGKKFGAI